MVDADRWLTSCLEPRDRCHGPQRRRAPEEMAIYKRGRVWWYKFTWNGEPIRESTKQGNKRIAEQIESVRKGQLAKGEVGIRDRAPIPSLEEFAKRDFLPYVESRFVDKPSTRSYYIVQTSHLV